MWGQNWGTMIWGAGAPAVPAMGFALSLFLAAMLAALAFWQMRRGQGRRWAAPFLLLLAALVPASVNALSLPFTFSNGTVANATQVNSNFESLRAGVTAVEGSGALVVTTFDQNSFTNITPVGTRVVVKSLPLPAGKHLVTATLDAVVVEQGICELVRTTPGPALDIRFLRVRLLPNFVPQQEISATIPVTLQADIELAAPETINLQCVTFYTPNGASLALQARAARMSGLSVASRTVVP